MTHRLMIAAVFCLLPLTAAFAQSGGSASSTACAPTQTSPNPNGIATTGKSGEPLGDKLARSDGVLCPPSGVDPDIRAPAPDAGTAKMPIIPPPGSPGGDPSVRPK